MQILFRGLLLILLCSLTTLIWAQKKAPIMVEGQVLDKQSEQPIEFATVMLLHKNTKAIITGTTTDIEGRFQILVDSNNFHVEVSFIGFRNTLLTTIESKDGKVNLGQILLAEDSAVLEDVVVSAERSQMEFKLDKKVFNVGKDLSSAGGSALDVLNNVPSVDVNIEGEVSLRGTNGVQILINGKPSILATDGSNALGSIAADMIEKIEVVTNPSAKYDAEGTAGILNIVLKKEERKGINGSISINTGYPHNHSIGFSINKRTEKFNLFSQVGVGYRSLPRFNRNVNEDRSTGTTILSKGTAYRNEFFTNARIGADYHINKQHMITFSGSFAYEIEQQPSQTQFKEVLEQGILNQEWSRIETTGATNPKGQYEVIYSGEFNDHKEHTLQISALGNFFSKKLQANFEDIYRDTLNNQYQQTNTNFRENRYTFNVDYVKPFSEKIKMELGGQYVLMDISNDFEVLDLINQQWSNNEGLTNLFAYVQHVAAAYATGSYEAKKWGVKLGLRVEHTDLKTQLVTTNENNHQAYTNFFPSGHASYKFTDNFSMQIGYSRRIFRPRLWDLNPFFNIRNNFSIRQGNPDLLPEFTDSYELTGIYSQDKISLNFSIYHKYTTDVIERVSTFENNVNTVMPVNVGERNTTGLELNAKYSPVKWLSINGDFNFNYFSRAGVFEQTDFSFAATRWSAKLMTKWKLPAKIDIELTGRYNSAVQTVQGYQRDNLVLDIGVRKKLLKGKAVISLSVRDILASRARVSTIDQDDFYIYSFSQRGRFITVGFSYSFGKGEAMEYSGRVR